MIKIFKVNDCDWIAAETAQQARDCAVGMSGEEDVFPLDEISELTEEQMDKYQFIEDASDPECVQKACSFREYLSGMIADGQKFPEFFASTEY